MKVKRYLAAAAAFALCAAIPLAAATTPASKSKTATKTAAKTAAKTATKTTAKAKAERTAWRPETFSAKIDMVDPAKRLVVLKTPDQVTYDIVVTAATKIESGSQPLTLKDLSQDKNRNVSVNFTPERRGDVARSIQIGG